MHNIFIQESHWIKYCLWPPLLYPLFFFVSLLSLSDGFSQQKRAKWRASIFLLLSFFLLSTLDISTDISIPIGYYPLCFSFARFSSTITQTLAAKMGKNMLAFSYATCLMFKFFFLDLQLCFFILPLTNSYLKWIMNNNSLNTLSLLKSFMYHNIGKLFLLLFEIKYLSNIDMKCSLKDIWLYYH